MLAKNLTLGEPQEKILFLEFILDNVFEQVPKLVPCA